MAKRYGNHPDFFRKQDIHIHRAIRRGAKDGLGGPAMVTA